MLRRLLAPLFLLTVALPLGAQTVVLDEGTFRILRGGQSIGTESFTIRRTGQGVDAQVLANAEITLDLPSGAELVKPLLQTGSDLSLSAYQVEVSGGGQRLDIRVTPSGRRLLVSSRSPTGDQEREFRSAPGGVLLEEGVAHQYWFLSQLGEGTAVNVLVPRAGAQDRIEVRSVRPESVVVAGAPAQARHVTFAINGAIHEVWYDAEDRVLKVDVPGTGFAAERTSR
jgi:hypothetical protein